MQFKIENISGTIEFDIIEEVNNKYMIFGVLIADFMDNILQDYDFVITKIFADQNNKRKIYLVPFELRKTITNLIKLEFIHPNIIYFNNKGELNFQAPKLILDPIKMNIIIKKLEKSKKTS